MNTLTRYSLNLSPRYAPAWGAWEVAREVICNAIDAAPEHYRIDSDGDNRLLVWTATTPTLDQLFVIGQGTKTQSGSTIGQFGEGLKMAALTATRATGGKMTIHIPGHQITFEFADAFGSEVLYAMVEDWDTGDGCTVAVDMPGIGISHNGRILAETYNGPRPKTGRDAAMCIFCKGVFIKHEQLNSLWDWNLNGLDINRDRSMVSEFSIIWEIGQYLQHGATPEELREIAANPTCFEADRCFEYVSDFTSLRKLADAFRAAHGDKAVLEGDDDSHNVVARSNGYRVVDMGKALAAKLRGIAPSATSVIPKNSDIQPVDAEPYREQITRLRKLDSIISAPNYSVAVFANADERLKGRADTDECRIWLSEGLFTDGNELELVRTYLHEAGHLMSGKGDATVEFEYALDGIAGRLAMTALGVL